MAKNPFGGKGGKAPKADPNVGRLAGVAEGLANETANAGRSQLAWQKVMDQARMGYVRPVVESQLKASADAYGRSADQQAQYRSVYQPNEGIQALDAMGAGWLSSEEQGRLIDLQSGQKLRSLKDAFDAEIAQIGRARASDTQSPIPVDATGPTTTSTTTTGDQKPPAVGGYNAWVPESLRYKQAPAATSVVTQTTSPGTVTTNPEQSKLAYDQAEAAARERFARESAGLESQAGYQKELINASKAAEDAASGRAVADATQGEGRFIQGLGMEASRMGVDPSRVLTGAGARAPSAAAAAVHGGNTARFGFREQRSNNLAGTVQSGRQAAALSDQELGLGADLGNAAVGNINNTFNSMTAGRTAPATWYSQGQSGINSAGNLYGQKQQQEMDAYRAKNERDSGFMDLLGTGIGLWANNGFALPSERRLKKNMKPADTKSTLDAIQDMDTDSWEYKPGAGDGGSHVGPYADDMAGLGLSDGKTVNPVDTAGLALAGVKQLTKEVRAIAAGLESKRRPAKRAA
jgi:hypothetical protein